MAVTLVVDAEDVHRKALQLREAAKHLQTRVVLATARVVQRVYKPTLIAVVPEFMPSGYAPVLARSLSVHTVVNLGRRGGVRIVITAPTGGRGREIRRLEDGVLRHPLFGNRLHWYTQKVRAGQAHHALRLTRKDIVRGLDHELDKLVEELAA